MIITEIRPVTRQKYLIETEGQPAFVLYKGEVARYHIEKGQELSEKVYREILEEVLIKRAKSRAMHLLEQGDRTKRGLQDKLVQNGYPPEAVEAAIAYVESYHYIDDKRYAVNYIQNQRGKKGRARLMLELRNKGVSQEDIEQAFSETEEDMDTREAIRGLILKKRGTREAIGEKERQKLYGFLMRRGFAPSDILPVLREFSDGGESLES